MKNFKNLNKIQKCYLDDVAFLHRLSKTSFGKVPDDLFDGLYQENFASNNK